MKTILLPFNGTTPSDTVIEAAVILARQYNGFVQAAWCRQTPPIIAGEGITLPAEYLSQFEHEERELLARAKSAFLDKLVSLNVPLGEMDSWSGVEPAASWIELEGGGAMALAEFARVFDVSVMYRPVPEKTTEWRTTCETILFEGGRPLLLVADEVPAAFGRNVVVAWNGSTETTRAIAMSMTLLCAAERVHVVEVEGGTVPGPSAKQVARSLRANGVDSCNASLRAGTGSVADAVFDYAEGIDADLIIKGAYTHSRLRALIFGGVTSDIFAKSTRPVLFCH